MIDGRALIVNDHERQKEITAITGKRRPQPHVQSDLHPPSPCVEGSVCLLRILWAVCLLRIL